MFILFSFHTLGFTWQWLYYVDIAFSSMQIVGHNSFYQFQIREFNDEFANANDYWIVQVLFLNSLLLHLRDSISTLKLIFQLRLLKCYILLFLMNNISNCMYGLEIIINWWKGKLSGSIACTRKQQPRFY